MNSMRRVVLALLMFALAVLPLSTFAQEEKPAEKPRPEETKKPEPMSTGTFTGLRLRSIGPAFTSGRVVDFAVDPIDRSRYFVAAASGGV